MGVYSGWWVRPQGGAGVLVFLQPGHLMCSLPLSLPPARTWGPVVKNIFPTLTLKKIMEEAEVVRGAGTSFSP